MIKAYNNAQITTDELDLKTCFYPELTQHYIGGFTKNLKEFYNYKIEENGEEVLPEHLRLFLKDYPIIEQTTDIWGIGKLKSLGFKESRIRIALQKEIVFDESKRQVINMLEGKISVGGIYSREYLISIFQEIYSSLGIEKIAKAIDIERYYEVKNTTTSKCQKKPTGAMKILALIG